MRPCGAKRPTRGILHRGGSKRHHRKTYDAPLVGATVLKAWVPVSVVIMIGGAYALLYFLTSSGPSAPTSLGVTNSIGLIAVALGLVGAGILLRRGRQPQ